MTEKEKIRLDGETGRVDKIVADRVADVTRSQIQQWFKEERIEVDGNVVRANYKVKKTDELVTFERPVVRELDLIAQNIPLTIVYEDEDVAVINKPQGMVVHPSAGHEDGTLVNALLYHLKNLSSINDVVRPGIVHRIDKDTSGLLMIAKNNHAHESLAEQLKAKTSQRTYYALVHGVIPHERGRIEAPIGRSKVNRKMQAVVEEGKPAVTNFEVLEQFAEFTLIKCQLETGRTHQIRVHLQYIGFPIAGDPLYGPKKTLAGKGQYLHAQSLGFTHPTTGEWLQFEAPLPELFQETLKKLEK